MEFKKILGTIAGILFFVVIISYGIFRSRDVLFGIRLEVDSIKSGQSVTEPILDLKGTAVHAISVTVDEQIAPLSEDGTWKDTLALLPGYNVISIIAGDKFGKSVSKELIIYYKAPPAPITPEPDASAVTIPKTSEPTPSAVQ